MFYPRQAVRAVTAIIRYRHSLRLGPTTVDGSPDTRRFQPRRRRKSCWPAVWISSRWPRLSCVCTPRRWPPGSRPPWSATGSGRPRPCTRTRSRCNACRPRGLRPGRAGTPGTRRPWARPVRAVSAALCRCPASASCGCGGCTWWPRAASALPGYRTSWSDRGRPRARKWRRPTSLCCERKRVKWLLSLFITTTKRVHFISCHGLQKKKNIYVSKSCNRVFLARAVTPQENLPLFHRPPGTCVLLTVTWIQNMEHDSARECHSDGYRFNWSLKRMTSRPTASRFRAVFSRWFTIAKPCSVLQIKKTCNQWLRGVSNQRLFRGFIWLNRFLKIFNNEIVKTSLKYDYTD